MSYIYDEGMTANEAIEYVNRCSARQAQDTKAFLEILRLIDDNEIDGYDTIIKIARICEERLKE